MSQDETIEITFKNTKGKQTHTFQKESIKDYGFFKGLLSNPLKESQTGQAEINFSTGQDEVMVHPVHFKFMEDLFQNLEKVFQQGNLTNLPLSGEFLYQVDKLLAYFMCPQFQVEILNEAREIFHSEKPSSIDVAYAALIFYDHHGFAIAAEEVANYYRHLESIEVFEVFYKTLYEIALESDFYPPLQKIEIIKLLNQVRGYLSPDKLGDSKVSEMLLMQPEDWEGYFCYQKSTHPLYFPETDLPIYEKDRVMVVAKDEALLRMTLMTQGVMKDMDWDNVILGGGAVNIMLDATLQPTDFPGSDIDIFIYGQTPDIRQNKVNQLLQYFEDQVYPSRRHFYAVRGSVVSIYIDDCPTVFQIISGISKTILDILHYFDMDHLRVAYQNGEFYMTIEAAEAFRTKTSYVHGYGTKPLRIWKAVSRGYNLVDNGSLVLNCNCTNFINTKDKYGREPGSEDPTMSPEKLQKITWQHMHNKFKSLKYKYYYPRTGEPDAKVVYEINLHTGCPEDNVMKDLLKVKKELILEGDFKTNFDAGYLGKFLDIDSEKLIFDFDNVTKKYFNMRYKQIDQFSTNNKLIGFQTPLFTVCCNAPAKQPYPNEYSYGVSSTRHVSNFDIFTNIDFLKFVDMISNRIFSGLKQNKTYIKLCKKNGEGNRINTSRVNFNVNTLTVKLKPEITNIYLKNKQKLSVSEANIFIQKYTSMLKCRFYADIYIDKYWIETLNDMAGMFVYMIKNLYLLDEIDESIYKFPEVPKNVVTIKPIPIDESDDIPRRLRTGISKSNINGYDSDSSDYELPIRKHTIRDLDDDSSLEH